MKSAFYYFLRYLLVSKEKKSHYKKQIERAKIETFIKKNPLFKNLSYERISNNTGQLSIAEQIKFFMVTKEYHNKSFAKYKNAFTDKNIVVCATGPSLKNYIYKKDCIHIGVNNIIHKTDIDFDFLFMQDGFYRNILEEFISYRNDKCKKFLISGLMQPDLPDYVNFYNTENKFNFDIDLLPLPDFTSVIFSAMAFALWTNPRKIYLVACDCSVGHYKSNSNDKISNEHLVFHWKKLKDFANWYYPNTEIISINPVGLKGLFKDEVYKN